MIYFKNAELTSTPRLTSGRIWIALVLLAQALSACGDKAPSAAPSEKQVAEAQAAEKFKNTDSFTLDCQGKYSLTSGGETKTGKQSFSISLSPKQGLVYIFEFGAVGYLDGTHQNMNNEVRKITRVTDDIIEIGNLELNRKTGKYTYSITTAGLCSKSPVTIQIPEQQF